VVRRDDGQFMGMVNYHHREPWNQRLELGWIIARPFSRQGYMTEAVGALLKHCFLALDVHRIEATINPANAASRALATRLGFQQEGDVMRDRLLIEGAFKSVLMFGLLRPDWQALRRLA
jgi:ribosomal-protein-alanine N-acetyltransferase